jgi:hypothetical protein
MNMNLTQSKDPVLDPVLDPWVALADETKNPRTPRISPRSPGRRRRSTERRSLGGTKMKYVHCITLIFRLFLKIDLKITA